MRQKTLFLSPSFVSFCTQNKVIFQNNIMELDFWEKKSLVPQNEDLSSQTFTLF